MKKIPAVIVSILAFLLGVSLITTYNFVIGIIALFGYLFLVFALNMIIPKVLQYKDNTKKLMEMKTLFLVLALVIVVLSIAFRIFYASKFGPTGTGRLDIIIMLLFATSCGFYNVYVALSSEIKEEHKE